jgi:hypothetical protein
MEYTPIATFNSRLEAETVAHSLDQHNIPFILKGEDVGLFLGGASIVPGGVTLLVPTDVAEQVEAYLDCVVHPKRDP